MLSGPWFAITAGAYLLVLLAAGAWAQRRVRNEDDFAVAGRRLSLPLSAATLFATWFGAGTLLSATDQARAHGLPAMALDPLGAGACLIIAGFWMARPLWDMRLTTLADFYRRRFGPRAEKVAAIVMIPGYFGWAAAQYVALAGMLELLVGVPLPIGIAVVALVGMLYTVIGGMWSVTATEAVQTVLLVIGLLWLFVTVFARLGDGSWIGGLHTLFTATPHDRLLIVDTRSAGKFVGWLGVFAVGALGNLPGQDLTQRIFSARSAAVARGACLLAGAAYITLGLIPPLLGLAADLLDPSGRAQATLPSLAGLFLTPFSASVFVVVVMSAVISTIESAILAPATVLVHNLLPAALHRRYPGLFLHRASVVLMTLASLAVAYGGSDAYHLLESAYEIGLAGMVVPLLIGVRFAIGGERAALAAMIAGTGLWLPHLLAGWEVFLAPWLQPRGIALPTGLCCATASALAYLSTCRTARGNGR